MNIGKIVGIIVVVLVLVIGGGAAYLASLDVDEYRSEIAQAAQDATGRVLQLEGPLSLAVSLTPTVSGEGVSLANAPWGSQPRMITLRRFEVELQLLPLLFGDVQVNRLVLIEPDILFETNAKGVGNWIFQPDAEDAAADTSGGGVMPHIGRLVLEKGLVTYRDGPSGTVTKVALATLEATATSADDPLHVNMQAAINDIALKLEGQMGPLKYAQSPDKAMQVDLRLEALGLSASIKGTAKLPTRHMDAKVEVAAADLSGLRPLAGDAVPAKAALKLSAHAKADDGNASLSDLQLTLGNSDLAGSISFDGSGALPKLSADLSGKKLDLGQLLPPGKDGAAKKAGAGKKSGRPGKVLPADPLPLDALKSVDANVKLALAEVVTPDLSLQNVSIAAKLSKGKLSLKPMALTMAGSAVTLSAQVDAGRKVPAVAFEMAAPKLDVGRLLNETKTTDLVQGTGNLLIKLTGQGKSVAAIAGNLNGNTSLLMNEGKVKTAAFDAAIGGLSAIMGMMSPEKSEWTVLNCVASRFHIKKGIATSKVLLADTEYSTIVGEGGMDLGKETLAMKVSPQSKSATLNVAVPVKIGGTFADPTYRPDELATMRRLGGLLGATLFPPAALLALADMGTDDDHPCLKIAKGGSQKPAAKTDAKTAEQPATGTATEAAKTPLDALKKGLGGLFGTKK